MRVLRVVAARAGLTMLVGAPRRCQRYEGGFAGEPGGEAHGGYAFCGAAALTIINQFHTCDVDGFTVRSAWNAGQPRGPARIC